MHKIFANTLFIGKQLISLPSCHSTNEFLAELAVKDTLFEGAVVITENQTKGKGQRGNSWYSEPGKNLTFSVYLRPKFLKPSQQFDLNRIVSLALYDLLKKMCPMAKVYIKWPNDLYVNKKKITGILIENNINQHSIIQSIVGIGLNVNQTDKLLETATSIKEISNVEYELNKVLSDVIMAIEHYYLMLRSNDARLIRQLYEEKLYKKDVVAYYEDKNGKFNGVIRGTEADGVLKIEDESGALRRYQFKEIHFLL
ncbi:biotin--[acetyl-CoA-carboxylase] ligase [Marivirga sp. S37H4]|uniref:Biotin--[acetyl-CoA-carboxylase] ligase n=1 Tax=Marivirga aurantiaca TaxID=2802615 RepID=A0A934X2P4_9BACT|nr:biotin--[acetyl-CoA-carboxylase] ligase [Marivirga aurantiaca]MBK6267181.1 biotin--[acetyl-CoA-carboxylase] ligase [Marivirga aurantiaca]